MTRHAMHNVILSSFLLSSSPHLVHLLPWSTSVPWSTLSVAPLPTLPWASVQLPPPPPLPPLGPTPAPTRRESLGRAGGPAEPDSHNSSDKHHSQIVLMGHAEPRAPRGRPPPRVVGAPRGREPQVELRAAHIRQCKHVRP